MSKITTRLQQAEDVIEQGLVAYREAGNALRDIRDEGLYKHSFNTFEEYLKTRWNWERAHAYRLIDAAEVASNLSPTGDIPPNERQARELTKLPSADLQRAAYGVAETIAEQNKAGKVTAKDVKKAVETVHKVIAENPTIKPEDIASKAIEHGAIDDVEAHDIEPEYTELDAAHEQIEDLQNMVAAGFIGGTDEDRASSLSLLSGLRKEIKTLQATLSATESQRDSFMRECAELKKQCAMQLKTIKKLQGTK